MKAKAKIARAGIESSLAWKKNNVQIPKLLVVSKSLSKEDSAPRLDAIVENSSLSEVSGVDVVALIYGENSSIFAASKTFVDNLSSGARIPIVFTWPKPFGEKVLDIDIIMRVLPDRSFR